MVSNDVFRDRRWPLPCGPLLKESKLKRQIIVGLTGIVLLAFLIGACSSGMTDDEKEIAIAVALTQTAAAPASALPTTIPTALPAVAETAPLTATVSQVAPAGDSPALPMPMTPSTSTVDTAPAQATAEPTAVVVAAVAPGSTEPLPVTQPAAKVRTLLVAPGEPGPLYALLTEESADNAPATNAQLLSSRDFGASWAAAPSGLPAVPPDCLYNVSMDYYGDTALFASTCQGLYRWSAATPQWTQLTEEATTMVAVVYGNANLMWATRPYTEGVAPLLRTQDGGVTWATAELTHTTGVANIGINPRDAQTGYAIVWPDEEPGSDLRRGSFFTDWLIMPGPNNNQPINTGMTIDGGTGNLFVTTRDSDGATLWYSNNPDALNIANVQWNAIYNTAPGINLELLSSGWSSQEDQISIYANFTKVENGKLTYALYRSLDSGRTWAPLVIGE